MLSEKIKKYLEEVGLYDLTEDISYREVMIKLGIDLETPFAQFNLYTNAITFSGRYSDIYNVC